MRSHVFTRFVGLALLLAVAAAALLTAPGGARAQSSSSVFQTTLMEPNQKTPEVSTDELRKILAEKSAFVFDSRPHKEYAISHIPGALNVSAKPGIPISVYVSDINEIGRVVGATRPRRSSCTATGCTESL